MSPLAKYHRSEPELTERFEFYKQQPVKEVLDGFQLEIKVGKIVEAGPIQIVNIFLHLKLILEKKKPRSVVAGLAEHYKQKIINQKSYFCM
ncbi:hypothetical protein ENUP19_0314G0013 [Entamoeba nuttalli]|uniref:Uncharacterized protein n=1 Tax=Entamoeba nuttalli TaxID=412467 RepID=A0ABQ0DVS6_9EUKA